MFTYKPELDGLRAVAVLSVILFHAGLSFIPGGFVGVDIFFVLSGYLITSIILTEIQSNSFSFSTFYERRIRRLAPPLIPVLLVTGVLSFTLFEQKHFYDTINSLASTLAISANWYFHSTVGYFDGPGELTPLLHMWSLAIEEQFYLFFPFILLATVRLKKNPTQISVILLSLSFFYSIYLIYMADIDLAFYGTPGRIWELLIGSALACARTPAPRSKNLADTLEISGATLILASIFLYSSDIVFPGPSALIPTIGTALLIAASGKGRFISPILKSKPLVWIGLISYGLYLWHWPLLVFMRAINPTNSPVLIAAAILGTFAFAIVSYYFLEQPIRQKKVFKTKPAIFKFGLTSLAAVTTFSILAYVPAVKPLQNLASNNIHTLIYDDAKSAILSRIETEKKRYHSELNLNFHGGSSDFILSKYAGYTCSFDGNNTQERVILCLTKQAKQNNVLVIGDSIGRDTTHALRRAFPSINFIMLHHSGCPPTEMLHRSKKITCFPNLESTLSEVAKNIKVNGIILNFSYRQQDWPSVNDSIPLMKRITKNVVMLGVTPALGRSIDQQVKALPREASVPINIYRNDRKLLPIDYLKLTEHAQKLAVDAGIMFADVGPFFCNDKYCKLWLNNSYDKPIFWDNQHITHEAMTYYGQYLSGLPQIQEVVSNSEI
ncbi:MAG: acyltransferase [Candidimonas sp.]|nr:acyltransferase [Candidimonas sp.]